MRLYGVINILNIKPGFLLPIFVKEKSYYIQKLQQNGLVDTFTKIDVEKNKIIKIKTNSETNAENSNHLVYDISKHELRTVKEKDQFLDILPGYFGVFSFIFPDGSIITEQKFWFANLLRERITEIERYPFVYLDVLQHLEEYQMGINFLKKFTDSWAKYELENFKKLLENYILEKQKFEYWKKQSYQKDRDSKISECPYCSGIDISEDYKKIEKSTNPTRIFAMKFTKNLCDTHRNELSMRYDNLKRRIKKSNKSLTEKKTT